MAAGGVEREPVSASVAANNRLTALTGGLLLVLLALLGITVLNVRQLLPQHFLLGFLVLPPLLLKMASTGYRLGRYYLGDHDYRAAGPPALLPRLLAPLVVISTIVVFATGIELWLFGLRFGDQWLVAHKLSFFVWLGATGVHVLIHLGKSADAAAAELSSTPDRALSRRSLVIGSLVAGVVMAAATLAYPSPFVLFND